MKYEKEIEIMRKTFMEEIEIDTDEYFDAVDFLIKNADLSVIKPLIELFYDDCYELSLMHNLDDLVLIIAGKHDKNGLLEVIRNLKYVKESGEYFGKEELVKMMLWGEAEYSTLLNILSYISVDEKDILASIILKIEESNIESLEKKLKEVLDFLYKDERQ